MKGRAKKKTHLLPYHDSTFDIPNTHTHILSLTYTPKINSEQPDTVHRCGRFIDGAG